MKTRHILFALLSIFLFGACHSPQTGVYNIMDYGATGDGKTDDASAIQKAINACSEAGGGTVLVPSGHTFLCGPFKLASYVELQLALTPGCWQIQMKVSIQKAHSVPTEEKA